MTPTNLPIEDCLDELKHRLNDGHEAVLEAPPGAGKTTLVPLALMDQPWLGNNKIVMLQPRRLATKSAAYRIADLIDQSPGDTIGYRMRMESKTGNRVKVEIVTEGIFTRMLQQDPSLAGVGLVIFDEFHERNLDSDLGLALCLQGRTIFRDDDNPLKILIMSATLDSAGVVEMLGNAPLIRSEGRAFPVDIIYGRARQPKESIIDRMFATIKLALTDQQEGSILAFVPGQGEIRQLENRLSEWLIERRFTDIHIRPLYGHLSIDEQQNAIAALSGKLSGQRKVVLATNIAETSLTIEGIDIVVDSGLARESRFDPTTGMSGLHTVKVSKASTVQRAGRAGRLAPGLCYRLWSEEQQGQLLAHSTPEILAADLAPLAMQLLQWGIDNPEELSWLNPPPIGPWQQALDLLQSLGAIEEKSTNWLLTDHGHNMGSLPVHPRLAHCLIRGAEIGEGKLATFIASLLSERDPLAGESPDIADRIDLLTGSTKCASRHQGWLHRCRQLAGQFERQLEKCNLIRKIGVELDREKITGYLLACAYPDRICRRRHSGGYQLANGRSARFYHPHRLDSLGWLVVAEVSGSVGGGRGDIIRSAASLDEGLFDSLLKPMITNETIAEWDKKSGRFIAEEQLKIGALVISRKPLDSIPVEIRTSVLLALIRQKGLQVLSWKESQIQWRARVALLRTIYPDDWPDLSDDAMLATIEDWLAPFLAPVSSIPGLKNLNLKTILDSLLSWNQQQAMDRLAPLNFKVPSGSSITIDYSQSPPVLAVKLQEMFGYEGNPAIADGKLPLLIHLLSPAGRPLQITQDLAGFWKTSYHDVKKDMKGRYPKHPWPEDPLTATATRKTKRHL